MDGYQFSSRTSTYREDLTLVERDTPMGEYLRRFWQPVGLITDATRTPKKVRVLAEDLILFRDGQSRAGLVHPRCCHRGSSLYYGKTENEGIRCCYHGWMFNVEGQCVDMPMEPENGAKVRGKIVQPWYPVEERYGVVFAYMGPPDKKPLLPRFELLENIGENEQVLADNSNLGSGGYGIAPCNWLQHYENVMDPFHVPILHHTFSGQQFVPEMEIVPTVKFSVFDQGVRSEQMRDLDEGKALKRITECILPNVRAVASPKLTLGPAFGVGFVLPVDSTNYLVYNVYRLPKGITFDNIRSNPGGLDWREMTESQRREFPGDWEAQVSQGDITYHSEEHLGSTDEGIAKLRRLLARQVKIIAEGGNPVGWTQTVGEEVISSQAGNFMVESQKAKKSNKY